MARRGLFWVACRYEMDGGAGDVRCDFSGTRLIVHVPPDQTAKTPSHMDVWPRLADHDRGKPWNYYPRGRVEIRGGRAIVFMNPLLFECAELEALLRAAFGIEDEIPVAFKADNSRHYRCAGNDDGLL